MITYMDDQPRVLILGKGYIGTNLYWHMLNDDSKFRTKIIASLVSREEVDYHNRVTLVEYIKRHNINVVVNCSGYTGRPNVDKAEEEKDLCKHLNVEVPVVVDDACNDADVQHIHISSGCIYSGYEKFWKEKDLPNFGVDNPKSSFYSKTKHMAEKALTGRHSNAFCIRVRMPFSGYRTVTGKLSKRDLFYKLANYDNIVDSLNSKTYLPMLIDFIKQLCRIGKNEKGKLDIYNCVCSEPLSMRELTEWLEYYGIGNPNWNFVEWEDLDIKAKRSNCLISNQKMVDLGFSVMREIDCIENSLRI